MRKLVKPVEQIDFVVSLIRKDIEHYEFQAEKVNKWIHMSILSLKQSEVSLLEELRDEYIEKALTQRKMIKEFQKTLGMYGDIEDILKRNKYADPTVYN